MKIGMARLELAGAPASLNTFSKIEAICSKIFMTLLQDVTP